MQIGFFFWPFNVELTRKLAALAETHDYGRIGIADTPGNAMDPWVSATLVAQETRRPRVVICVTNLASRHPAVSAAAIASIDALSGGRAILGIGAGHSGTKNIGVTQKTTATMLREGVSLIKEVLKGGAPAITDLLGGQINLAVIAAGAAVPHLRAGRLKGLAVSGAQRSRAMPNVPTMAESGYPQLESGAWVGLLVPAGTPAPVIARLNAEFMRAIKEPAIIGKLAEQSIEVAGSTPEQFGAFIRAEHDKWGKVIKDAKLNIEQ